MPKPFDRTPLTPEQKKLAEELWPLARRIARYWRHVKAPFVDDRFANEFESMAGTALCQAVKRYDKEKCPNLNWYVFHRLQRDMAKQIDQLRHKGFRSRKYDKVKKPSVLSIFTPISRRKNSSYTKGRSYGFAIDLCIADTLHDHNQDFAKTIEDLTSTLPPRKQYVVRKIWIEGYSYRDLAKELELSHTTIQLIVLEARELVRRQLYNNDDECRPVRLRARSVARDEEDGEAARSTSEGDPAYSG